MSLFTFVRIALVAILIHLVHTVEVGLPDGMPLHFDSMSEIMRDLEIIYPEGFLWNKAAIENDEDARTEQKEKREGMILFIRNRYVDNRILSAFKKLRRAEISDSEVAFFIMSWFRSWKESGIWDAKFTIKKSKLNDEGDAEYEGVEIPMDFHF